MVFYVIRLNNGNSLPFGNFTREYLEALKLCSEYKSNESFSGKGHANHICKRCSKKSITEQDAGMTLNRLFNLPFRKP